jgi:GNAT superfamily N-acetyltransferase
VPGRVDQDRTDRGAEGCEIRAARPGDEPLVMDFVRELAAYERLSHAVRASAEDVREALFGEPRRAEVLLAFDAGAPVGFALFFHNYSTFLGRVGLYLEDLFVRPAARGRGYGKALLQRLAAIARERGCGRMEWAVLDWNEPAIEFYDRLGARPMRGWTIYRLEGEPLGALADGRGRE